MLDRILLGSRFDFKSEDSCRGVVPMAGDDTKGHPAGTKIGNAIHVFESGSIQMVTDVVIAPAGNAWVADNWDVIEVWSRTTRPAPSRPRVAVPVLS